MHSTYKHSKLGEVTVTRTRRAKRISISVRPPGKIRLTLPMTVSLKEGVAFINAKEEWIRQTILRYGARYPAETIAMPYSTREHSLALNPKDITEIKTAIRDGSITVTYPLEMNYTDEEVQMAIKKGIEEAWRKEAKKWLPKRIAELSQNTGLRYRSVAVRNTVSKWGSCSARDDISLSLHLMRLPDYLVDYIIVHELCHTVHKNHGPAFHTLLDKHTGGMHWQWRRELKRYHTRW